MTILVYKNEISGAIILARKPNPDKKVRAMAIGMLTNEIGLTYPRIYDIPIAVSDWTFARISSKKYWDSYFSEVFDMSPHKRRASLIKAKALTEKEGKSIIRDEELTFIYKTNIRTLNEDLQMGSAKYYLKSVFIGEDSNRKTFVENFCSPFTHKNLGAYGTGGEIPPVSKDDLLCDVGVVLQKIRVDDLEKPKTSRAVRRVFLEKGDTVFIQVRGPYRPVIHSINSDSSVLQDMKLVTEIDMDEETFIKTVG